MDGSRTLDWDEFTNYIIEKATILNSNNNSKADSIKNYTPIHPAYNYKSDSIIERVIDISPLDKLGTVEE